MNKKGKLISGCLALSVLLAAGGALTIKAPALVAENTVTMTIEMNGGFRVTSRDTTDRIEKTDDNRSTATFSEGDMTVTEWNGAALTKGTELEFTYENIKRLFPYGAFEKYTGTVGDDGKASDDYMRRDENNTANSVNNFYITDEGYYYPQLTKVEQFPTALLFGLFEDKNDNGVVDDGEPVYYQGDSLTVSGDLTLKCFYDPLFAKDQRFSTHYWQAGEKYIDKLVWLVVGTSDTTKTDAYKATDMQPFCYELYGVRSCAFRRLNISAIEFPSTVQVVEPLISNALRKVDKVTGLDNVTSLDTSGNNAVFSRVMADLSTTGDKYTTVVLGEKVGLFKEKSLVAWGKTRWIFTGFDADKLSKDSGGKTTTPLGLNVEKALIQELGTENASEYNYMFVPYGETDKWYPTPENTSGYTQTYMGLHYGTSASNVPMREAYKVAFNLNGGKINNKKTIADEFMDAGSKAVTINGTEVNAASAADISLLKATKPADPTKEGYEFIGWEDQFGYVWTDEDWANGGKNDYETGVITLSAKWQSEDCAFSYATLSLDGTIGVNMYASLSTEALTTEERVFVKFTYADNSTEEVELDKNNYKQINGETCYKFTARVAAADTDKAILCGLFVGETEKATYTIKVEDYTAYEKANNAKDSERYKLADALETYGKAARTYFGESTETVTVDGENAITAETLSAYAPSIGGGDENVTVQDVTLLLESKTALRIYFKVTDETQTVSVTVDGTVATAKKSENRNGLYYVEIDDIAASDLDHIYTVVIGGYTVKCGALSYVRAAISSDKANTVNMVKALYLYHAAAKAYFN